MARTTGTLDPAVFKCSFSLFLLMQHYHCQGQSKSRTKDIHLKDKMKVLPVDKEKHMLEHFRHFFCSLLQLKHLLNLEFRSAPRFLSHTKLTHPPATFFFGRKIHPVLTYESLTMRQGVLFLLSFAYDQYRKLLEAFIYRIFTLPLHRSMETVRKDIASKDSNPKVRQDEGDLDFIVAFKWTRQGGRLFWGFSTLWATAHYFMDVSLRP